MDNEKKELIEKFIDCLVVCSVELEQSIYFWLFKFRSILRACRINRLTRLNLFNIQLLVNDLTASHNSFVQLHQLKFHVSKLSPLFYDSIRSLVVWPYLTNRLRTRWQQAHLMYPFVISRTVLEQLGHASCVAQRLSTHRWSAIQLFIARFRVRLAQQIKNRMVRMQQPHAQQLPLFVIGSFVICNCFANGQTVVAIIFFALLQISMIFLKQKPLDRLFDAMIHRQQTDNVLWNDLHQSLMSTEFPFSVIQNDIKFLNYCLINLWPTLLMPAIQEQIELNIRQPQTTTKDVGGNFYNQKMQAMFSAEEVIRVTSFVLSAARPPLLKYIAVEHSSRSDQVSFKVSISFWLDLCLFDTKSEERHTLPQIEFDTIGRLILPISSHFDHFIFYAFEVPILTEPIAFERLIPHSISLPHSKLLHRPLTQCFVFPNRLICSLRRIKQPPHPIRTEDAFKSRKEDWLRMHQTSSASTDMYTGCFAVCLVNLLEAINLPTLNIQQPIYVCHVQLGTHHFHTRMQRNRQGCPRFDQSFAASIYDLNEPLQIQIMLKESEQNAICLGWICLDLLSFYSRCQCAAKSKAASSIGASNVSPIATKSFEPIAVCDTCRQTRTPSVDQEINFRIMWLPLESDHESTSGFVRLRIGVQRLFKDVQRLARTLNQLQNLNTVTFSNVTGSHWIDKPLSIPLAVYTIEVQRVQFQSIRRLNRMIEINGTGHFFLLLTYHDQTHRVPLPGLFEATFQLASSANAVSVPQPSKRVVQFVCWQSTPKQKITITLQTQPHKSRSYSLASAVLQLDCALFGDHRQSSTAATGGVHRNTSVSSIESTGGCNWSLQDTSLELLLTCSDRSIKQPGSPILANATLNLRAQFTDLRNECVVNLLSDRRPRERISRHRRNRTVNTMVIGRKDVASMSPRTPSSVGPNRFALSKTAKHSKTWKHTRHESLVKSRAHKVPCKPSELVEIKQRPESICAILLAFALPKRNHLVVDLIRLIDVPLFDTNRLPRVRVRVNLWSGIERLGQVATDILAPNRDPFIGDRFEFELPHRMFGQMMVKLQVEQSLGWWPAVVRFGSTDNVLAEGFIQVPPLEAGGMTPPEWFNLLKVGM